MFGRSHPLLLASSLVVLALMLATSSRHRRRRSPPKPKSSVFVVPRAPTPSRAEPEWAAESLSALRFYQALTLLATELRGAREHVESGDSSSPRSHGRRRGAVRPPRWTVCRVASTPWSRACRRSSATVAFCPSLGPSSRHPRSRVPSLDRETVGVSLLRATEAAFFTVSRFRCFAATRRSGENGEQLSRVSRVVTRE